MHRIQDFGILVQHLTNRPVLRTIIADDLRQPVIAGIKPQYSFVFRRTLFSWVGTNNREDKDASLFVNSCSGKTRKNQARTFPQQKRSRPRHAQTPPPRYL